MLKKLVRRCIPLAAICAMFVSAHALADAPSKLDVPAGELVSALKALVAQADIQLVYQPEQLKDIQTAGVKGVYSAQEAVAILLRGTPLRVHTASSGAMVISPVSTTTSDAAEVSDLRLARAEEEKEQMLTGKDTTQQGSEAPYGKVENQEDVSQEVVVTGSHIRGAPSASPVIVVGQTEIERSGYQSIGEVMRSLPQNFGGGYNATVIGGGTSSNPQNNSGSSSPNLRGLGSQATLTLVNGHRLSFADISGAVDISLIPLPVIERVEVLTDGASALYGSDAVAGVVNFILRKDYEGVQASAAMGDSTDGGGFLQQYNLMTGARWGQGGAVVAYEHSQQDAIFGRERDYLSPGVARTSLLPETDRDSLFVSAHQSLSSNLSVFLDGLYTRRSSEQTLDRPGNTALSMLGEVDQFGVVAGAQILLGNSWRASVTGDVSSQTTDTTGRNYAAGTLSSTDFSTYDNKLKQVEVAASGPLFQLPSGAVDLAVGASYRQETFWNERYTIGSTAPPTEMDYERDIKSVFGEVNLPIVGPSAARRGLQGLNLTLAGRYEDNDNFGSVSTPKVGLVYTPAQDVQFKASWGKAFHTPSLIQSFATQQAYLFRFPDPASTDPDGASTTFLRLGGNLDVGPETAKSSTVGVNIRPSWLGGSSFDLTYYRIDYRDRIVQPISNYATPLTDPYQAPFIQRNPTQVEQAAIIAASPVFENYSGQPYDPATIVAVIDGRYNNAAIQTARGVDALMSYLVPTGAGDFDFTLNAAYLDLEQQGTVTSPVQQASGTVFNPAKFRARGGVNWQRAGWSSTLLVNHVGSSGEPLSVPARSVSSWTTADVSVAYSFVNESRLSGTRIALSAQNLLDKEPPYVAAAVLAVNNLNFDPTNATAIGRFWNLKFSKTW